MKRRHPQTIDHDATLRACFIDGRSYIRKDKTYLFGVDMTILRQKAFDRSRGYCEQMLRGVLGGRCNRNISWETMELDHVPSLAQGGDDTLEGVVASCKRCHVARHNREPKWTKREPVGAGSRKKEAEA